MSEQFLADETNPPTACDVLYAMACRVILENASGCLRHSSYPQLRKIRCEFDEGVLMLHGVVGSYFLKQLAHLAVVDVVGVQEIANQLEVRYPVSKANDPDNEFFGSSHYTFRIRAYYSGQTFHCVGDWFINANLCETH